MHLEILTLVARIDAVKHPPVRLGHALAVENLGGRTSQLGKRGGDLRPGLGAGRRDPGLRQVEAQIGMKDAAGAQGAGLGRNDDARNAEFARDVAGMQRARAAIGKQREVPEIVAALGRDRADGARHARIGDAQDALGRRFQRQTQRSCHLPLQHAPCRREIDRQSPAEQRRRVEPAEQQIGVSRRCPLSAAAITGRARIGAGAVRSDLQRAGIVEGGDAAAAGADHLDVDHRPPHRIAGDDAIGGEGRPAGLDQRHIGAGAADIEGDEVGEAGGRPDRRRANDPGSRPRQAGAHRKARRGRHRISPPFEWKT